MWDRIELSNCLVQYRKFIHDQVDVTNQWSVDELISNGAGITGYLYGEIRFHLYIKHENKLNT